MEELLTLLFFVALWLAAKFLKLPPGLQPGRPAGNKAPAPEAQHPPTMKPEP